MKEHTVNLKITFCLILISTFIGLASILFLNETDVYALDNTPTITYNSGTSSSNNNASNVGQNGANAATDQSDTTKQAASAVSAGNSTVNSQKKDINGTTTNASSNMNSQVEAIVGSGTKSGSIPTYSTNTGNLWDNLANRLQNVGIWLIAHGLSFAWICGFVALVYGVLATLWGVASKKGSPKSGIGIITVSIVLLVGIGLIQFVPGIATYLSQLLKSLFS